MSERLLSPDEIKQLEKQGCRSNTWEQIFVSENFSPYTVHNTVFSGENHLGHFNETILLTGNMPVKAGIYNATIHQCIVGDNCYIKNIQGYIANYQIGSRSVIHNCGIIVATEKTTYGQGTMVNPVNEGGGREMPIYDRLSSNMAHILVHYRYKPKLVERLVTLISQYTRQKIDKYGRIGMRVKITNCQSIENVHIDSHAIISEVTKLFNGTINSSMQFPTRIESGVIAKYFIIGAGSRITNGAHIERCFIGQSCLVSHNFTAENSLVFANSELLNGEAVSIMAGPFTVSHHKTTLLIAAGYSFFNAGSGTNQSNHHYKLGPTHQAILDRGVKTASNSYILAPAHIGAFTFVSGSHRQFPDTSLFPFSYLVEDNKESILLIGQNMTTIGMFRDERKWFQRDNRPVEGRLDRLEVAPLNPVTVGQMIKAVKLLKEIESGSKGMEALHGFTIRTEKVPKFIYVYEKAIKDFLYEQLFLEMTEPFLHQAQRVNENLEWIDAGGMITPKWRISDLIAKIEDEQFQTILEVEDALSDIFNQYSYDKRTWSLSTLKSLHSLHPSIHPSQAIELALEWIEIQKENHKMLMNDALKDFSPSLSIGYGMDGADDDPLSDFAGIRGKAEEHNAVKQCNRFFEQRINWADAFIKKMSALTR